MEEELPPVLQEKFAEIARETPGIKIYWPGPGHNDSNRLGHVIEFPDGHFEWSNDGKLYFRVEGEDHDNPSQSEIQT